ncbi:hypothetical protein CU669_15160 [Paramagnetospirillum kuznetsovii]|uniref:Uncharacterized protein n=1 Tax=Paramagnetospirillum kuznetsovii TaxID=2053833 RepID=A0A364NVI0_9PROT|nr:hypothetical protein [Paramagnetospirillum kuznetsovii]RAU21091.1 hypothetical protein CU669_15160 [Paramagnetospirillum kuznetsovii]
MKIFGFISLANRRRQQVTPLPAPVECPPTQAVNKRRSGNYVTVHRLLLAETGMDLPAVKKMVGVQ